MEKKLRCWKVKKCGWVGTQEELAGKRCNAYVTDRVCPRCGAKTFYPVEEEEVVEEEEPVQDVRPYCPSNGTEGEMFAEDFCYRCAWQDDCDIPLRTMFLDVTDPNYPAEWIVTPDGPTCTAFRAITKPEGVPREKVEGRAYAISDQLDLFGDEPVQEGK